MPTQDTSQIKEKILFTLRRKGPCLPVHIANEIQTSILFASAFLSELVSEKKIKMSYMRVGNSPLYFIPGQEYLLERFSQYLRSKEKDAFELLKRNRFLIDAKQEPAIRVALRSIRDFAIPFKQDNEIIWKYYTERNQIPLISKPIIKKAEPIKEEFIVEKPKELDIFGEEEREVNKKSVKKAIIKKTTKKITASQKKNEKFFDKVKEFLAERSINISDIEGFSKTDLILRVTDAGVEKVLIAYNKRRLTEADFLKACKKALEYELPYIILSLGDIPKKLENLITAAKKLSRWETIN